MNGRARSTRTAVRGAPTPVAGTWVSGSADQTMEELKPEEEMETEIIAEGSDEVVKVRPAWMKVGPDGKPIKRKPNPAKRNAMFRKYLQPKTAVMCLNELVVGLQYDVESLASVGNFGASVDVNGVVYRGYGSSKSLAKQAAAEAALVSFVKPPPPKSAAGEPEVADETPWKTIASFAMYKLFAEWSEGNSARHTMPVAPQGAAMPATQAENFANPAIPDLRHYITEMQNQQIAPSNPNQQNTFNYPMPNKPPQAASTNTPQPAKNLSEEVKLQQHPVMVLHQLSPMLVYEAANTVDPVTKAKSFTITVNTGSDTYTAEGSNVKKAKFNVAKIVLKEAFGVDNVFQVAATA